MTTPVALEERIAHLEATLDTVSEVVARQDEELQRLRRQVAMLLEREAHRQAEGESGLVLGDDRPPHY